jgi:3-hydroxybutyryl-CoA dehydrogenase
MARKSQPIVFLIGDAPLVEEFGKACHDAGITVTGRINQKTSAKRAPAWLKVSTTIPRTTEVCFELTNSDVELKKKNILFLEKRSSSKSIVCSSSVIVTASQQAAWMKTPLRLIGMCAFPTLLSQTLIEIAPTRHTESFTVHQLNNFFAKIGKQTAIVQDRIGMVMPRILCMLTNEAAFALTENVATPQDIDVAMKLGTNYPLGPVEWGDKIGFSNVLAVLNALFEDLHEERYRAAPLLQLLATGAKWWGT